MSTSHRGISEELVPHLLVVQLLQKHYSSGASIDRGPPDLYGTDNAARAGVDGLSVRCKCAARRTARSGNLGGAARHPRDPAPDTWVPKGHLAGPADRRQRPSA